MRTFYTTSIIDPSQLQSLNFWNDLLHRAARRQHKIVHGEVIDLPNLVSAQRHEGGTNPQEKS